MPRHVAIVTSAIAAILAVSPSAAGEQQPKAPKVVSLSGCIEPDLKSPGQFTLTDKAAHRTYRVTGLDFREYAGRLVEVDGGVNLGRVTVKGGLRPNPNVAAQAGAMDPSRAAVASAVAESTTGGDVNVQEFRVKTIRPTGGSCR
jgi:hypothetical protein